jgi:hypothetical protein
MIDGAIKNELLRLKLFDISNNNFIGLKIKNIADIISNSQLYEALYSENSMLKAFAEAINYNGLIKIFPIPANDKLNVESEMFLDYIQIFDLKGNMVFDYESSKSGSDRNIQFSIDNLPSGEYNIKLFSDENVINKKLIISR